MRRRRAAGRRLRAPHAGTVAPLAPCRLPNASSTRLDRLPAWHAPTVLMRYGTDRPITQHELASLNRCAPVRGLATACSARRRHPAPLRCAAWRAAAGGTDEQVGWQGVAVASARASASRQVKIGRRDASRACSVTAFELSRVSAGVLCRVMDAVSSQLLHARPAPDPAPLRPTGVSACSLGRQITSH